MEELDWLRCAHVLTPQQKTQKKDSATTLLCSERIGLNDGQAPLWHESSR